MIGFGVDVDHVNIVAIQDLVVVLFETGTLDAEGVRWLFREEDLILPGVFDTCGLFAAPEVLSKGQRSRLPTSDRLHCLRMLHGLPLRRKDSPCIHRATGQTQPASTISQSELLVPLEYQKTVLLSAKCCKQSRNLAYSITL